MPGDAPRSSAAARAERAHSPRFSNPGASPKYPSTSLGELGSGRLLRKLFDYVWLFQKRRNEKRSAIPFAWANITTLFQ